MDSNRLLALMLAADFNLQELNRLSSEYLGVDGSSIMLDGDLARRTEDLVKWADRKNMLDNLLEGVLLEGVHKRAIREWILNAQTAQRPDSALDDPRLITFLRDVVRNEVGAVEDRMIARVQQSMAETEQRIMDRLSATLATAPTHRIAPRYMYGFFGAFLLMFLPTIFYYSDVRAHVGITWFWAYMVTLLLWAMAGALWYYVFFMRVQ